MVGCNEPMLDAVVFSVGSVPQRRCVLLPNRIAKRRPLFLIAMNSYLNDRCC